MALPAVARTPAAGTALHADQSAGDPAFAVFDIIPDGGTPVSAVSAAAPASTGQFRFPSRYALSAGGPLSISAAHFIASLLVLRVLPSAEFGIFSFVLVVVPLCLSACGALLIAPLARAVAQPQLSREAELATHLKVNLVFCGIAMLLSGTLTYGSGAPVGVACVLGVYGGTMCLRWFARAVAYADDKPARVAASDVCYSVCLVGALAALWGLQSLTIAHAAAAMAASASIALLLFGAAYLRKLLASLWLPLRGYAGTWRDLTRWSLLGVVLTEATANAHAYLVTFLSGAHSFALLAIGALFMRPVSLCLSALPDVERPLIARCIAAGDFAGAERSVREFRAMGTAVWIATAVLGLFILAWAPSSVLGRTYPLGDIASVAALWCIIMAVRLLRTPDSVLLQAAGEFHALARTTYLASAVSVTATLALLLLFGPIASLCGILAGDAAMTAQILSAARKWRLAHG
jgi:hypothetical protein